MLRIACLAALAALPARADDTMPGPFAAFDIASEPVLDDPHDLAFGPDGLLYVADKFGDRIAVFDPETLELKEMLAEGMLPNVHDISFGPDGRVAVSVTGLGAVALYDSVDDLDGPPTLAIRAASTEGALIHSSGRVYAMASGYGRLSAFDGESLVAVAEGLFGAHDVAEAPDGSIWVADNRARRLVRFSPDLEVLQVLEHPKFRFLGPRYLDVTEAGYVVVADQDAHRVLLIDPEGPDGGSLLGVLGDGMPGLGPGRFDDPEGVAVRGAQFFVSDSDNDRIVRYAVILN